MLLDQVTESDHELIVYYINMTTQGPSSPSSSFQRIRQRRHVDWDNFRAHLITHLGSVPILHMTPAALDHEATRITRAFEATIEALVPIKTRHTS